MEIGWWSSEKKILLILSIPRAKEYSLDKEQTSYAVMMFLIHALQLSLKLT